jgi:hypothetical protein
MSEARNPFEVGPVNENPYAVGPAVGVSLAEAQRHDSGNAIAANAEARAVAEVKAQVLMARQFPRDPRAAMERILRECERPTLADKATYTFPRGKETVSGPSIRMAEMMARNWGNNSFGLEVLERKTSTTGVGQSVLRAYAWDLETNTYISRQFELKHWRQTQSGGYALKDDRDIYELEANMGSRRMRACILQMLPGDVTQAAVDKCRMVAASGIVEAMKDKGKRMTMITRTLQAFEAFGVKPGDLEKLLGTKGDDWTADHILRLKEIKNGLDDGVLSLGDVFPHLAAAGQNDKITREQAEALMALIAQTSKQGDISQMLKKKGIAKVADIPTAQHDEIAKVIRSYLPEKPGAPEQTKLA